MGNQLNFLKCTDKSNSEGLLFSSRNSTERSEQQENKKTKILWLHDKNQLKQQKQYFDFRLKNSQFIVYSYAFQLVQKQKVNLLKKLNCNSDTIDLSIKFYYDQITQSFSELYYLPIQDGIILLIRVLQGFSLLYNKFGYFRPQPSLIMKQGNQWKVWINSDIFALKNKQHKKSKNQELQSKFLKEIIHLFDMLRDQHYPQFSYSQFVYGKLNINKSSNLKIDQIIQKLSVQINIQTRKDKKQSLRKFSSNSNESIQRIQQFNRQFSDYSNNMSRVERTKKINSQSYRRDSKLKSYQVSQRTRPTYPCQNQVFNIYQLNSLRQNFQTMKENTREFQINQQKQQQHEHCHLKRTSSRFLNSDKIQNIEVLESIENKQNKYKSSISTPSNCTGWTKQNKNMTNNVVKYQQLLSNFANMTKKKQRSLTTDFTTSQSKYLNSSSAQQPRRITQNSESNEHTECNDCQNFQKSKKIYSQSNLQILITGQSDEKQNFPKPISKNSTNKTPSIDGQTRKNSKQTMKFLKEFMSFNKNKMSDHKRSFTDQQQLLDRKNMKICCSQEFQSAFFLDENQDEDKSESQIQNQTEKNVGFGKKARKTKTIVKKTYFEPSQENQYDKVNELSVISNSSSQRNTKLASIAKMTMFKSEGGLKGLFINNNGGTLNTIKQIQVDVPIDEEILNDLNKMYKKHRFAKSTTLPP